ncbi:MAG TPA: class I SAM-dependent methyltransferase [Anaerolineae bacterium]|nr:class I SAM-dependent methyltransferase [Anaerolineae bacterium]
MRNILLPRVYLSDRHALAYFREASTPEFWDRQWQVGDLRTYLQARKADNLHIRAAKRYLSPGSIVLEGGCGRGQLVHALQVNGYRAIGIDFAVRTVHAIRRAMPDLDVLLGDVRNLPIADGCLDGYVSVGVIEHFWEGYNPILDEIHRTLRPSGFLFISFPYMSPLRRWKVRLRAYPTGKRTEYATKRGIFYQFALPADQVQRDLERVGFRLLERLSYDGIKGFKDEVACLQPWLQPIYDGKKHRHLRPLLERLLRPFASHCVLLVMQKAGGN